VGEAIRRDSQKNNNDGGSHFLESSRFYPIRISVPSEFQIDQRIPVENGALVVAQQDIAIRLSDVLGRLGQRISCYNAADTDSPEHKILKRITQDTLDYLANEMVEDEEKKENRVQRLLESARYYIESIIPLLLKDRKGSLSPQIQAQEF